MQEITRRMLERAPRHIHKGLTVVLVVFPAVLELLSDTRADFDVQVVRYGHVAAVEQRVKVGPEEQPIRNELRTAFGVRANVRRL